MDSRKFRRVMSSFIVVWAFQVFLVFPVCGAVVTDGDVDESHIGNTGPGHMWITDGSVYGPSQTMILGNGTGKGVLTIHGPGSTWDGLGHNLILNGNRSWLHVLDGGTMQVNAMEIAVAVGSVASVRLQGEGARLSTGTKWSFDGGYVNVGSANISSDTNGGRAMLTLSGGATLETGRLRIGTNGRVGIKVTGDNMLTMYGWYNSSNSGKLLLMADNTLASGTYKPIKSVLTSGNTGFVSFGGSWINDSYGVGHFTVKDALTAEAGEKFAVNWGDRAVITDSATGQELTYSSQWAVYTSQLQVSFRPVSQADLDHIQAKDETYTVLAGWWHSIAVGGAVEAQAMFTLNVGTGLDVEELVFWQHRVSDNTWVKFSPEVYTYDDDGTLSFISSTLHDRFAQGKILYDGFVITGRDAQPIPEPATIAFLMAGVAGIARKRLRQGHRI
ncbi:MAG: PEP-CTERM sorting domain-containing protein [Phycisphaerae bacterium]|nr:PEP-CTERM sorting domain-containing protein [Phycisphaerae bacterium]